MAQGRIKEPIWGFMKDAALPLAILAVAMAALYLYAGVWPPLVSVGSDSMVPNMERGDLVIIQGLDRGGVRTYEGQESVGYAAGYAMFGETGDVIVYRPYGYTNVTPIIHRAIRYVNESEPMWHNGPPAPHAGYITMGDANQCCDQVAEICAGQPVEAEWIIGVARYRIPYLGYVRSLLPS
jgi:signal peptidase